MSLCINVNVCVYGVDGDAKRCKRREIIEAGGDKKGLRVEGVV